MKLKRILILGINSDIGTQVALRYIKDGHQVVGTYRSLSDVEELMKNGARLIHCDFSKKESIECAIKTCNEKGYIWDVFISFIGDMKPISPFFNNNFDEWETSININVVSQLRFLHGIYALRHKERISNIIFMAGGGTNNAFPNYSAYCVSKIMLIKMCELLDDENEDMNICIIGPGFVKTKIHEQTINNRHNAGANYTKTLKFMEGEGTTYEEVYDCINWCIESGKSAVGGRNISLVYDHWRDGGISLIRELEIDNDKYKLRRYGNK